MCKECDNLRQKFYDAPSIREKQTRWNTWQDQKKKCEKEAAKAAKKDAEAKSKEDKEKEAKFI